ncbi:conserved hypothetical protein [Candidatus Sulfopaludibacter sp. SbA4]|nr:conserved hypothetical protein [Candidatus Sulfopaludibacter sp. SbA4]
MCGEFRIYLLEGNMLDTRIKLAVTCAVAALFMTRPALALNNRSWVSHLGSDLNTCSSTDPCKTFQHAHDSTIAGGEVDALDPGDFGLLVITKPITIDGANMGYIQLQAGIGQVQAAIHVNAPAGSKVILRNLSLSSLPAASDLSDGIWWTGGQYLFVEGVSVNGVEVGIEAGTTSGDLPPQLFVKDVTIRNCSNSGIFLHGPFIGGNQTATNLKAVVDYATIENVTAGLTVQTGRANLTHSVISHATFAGIVVTNSGVLAAPGGEVNVEDSSISYSKFGVFSAFAGSLVRIAGDNIHDNDTGLLPSGGGLIVSFGDNRIAGNTSGETPSSTVALK